MKTKRHFVILFTILIISCVGCVQETHQKRIEVQVDMRLVEEVQTVGIRGNLKPLSWETDYPMEDTDGDGIYRAALVIDTASDFLQFKFVLNGQIFELDDKPNRRLEFKYVPENLSYSGVFDQN